MITSLTKPKIVALMSAQIAAGMLQVTIRQECGDIATTTPAFGDPAAIITASVSLARAIVAEVERTETT